MRLRFDIASPRKTFLDSAADKAAKKCAAEVSVPAYKKAVPCLWWRKDVWDNLKTHEVLNVLAIWGHFLNVCLMLILWSLNTDRDVCIPTSVQYNKWVKINIVGNTSKNVVETNSGTFQITPVTSEMMVLSLHWLIVSFHALSFVFQGLTLTPFYNYKSYVDEGRNPLRFFEYSISASIMLICIALVNGVRDQNELIMIGVLCGITQLLGYMAEYLHYVREKVSDKDEVKKHLRYMTLWAHGLGWVSVVVSYAILSRYFVLSVLHNESGVDVPSFVWAIVIVIAALYMSFGVVQGVQINLCGCCKNVRDEHIESAYTGLSLVAKTILGWVIYGEVLAMSRGCSS